MSTNNNNIPQQALDEGTPRHLLSNQTKSTSKPNTLSSEPNPSRPIPPPKQNTQQERPNINPHNPQTRLNPQPVLRRIPTLIFLTDPQEQHNIVRDDAVHACTDGPPHHAALVDGPDEEGAVGGTRVAHEAVAAGAHEDLLEESEGDMGDVEELAGGAEVEADVGCGEAGEVFGAEGEVFGL